MSCWADELSWCDKYTGVSRGRECMTECQLMGEQVFHHVGWLVDDVRAEESVLRLREIAEIEMTGEGVDQRCLGR